MPLNFRHMIRHDKSFLMRNTERIDSGTDAVISSTQPSASSVLAEYVFKAVGALPLSIKTIFQGKGDRLIPMAALVSTDRRDRNPCS